MNNMRAYHISGTLLFVLLFMQGLSQPGHQSNENMRITLSFDNVSIKRFVREMERHYGLACFVPSIAMDTRISIHVKDVTLKEVLDKLSSGLPVRFSSIDKVILVQWKRLSVKGIVMDANRNRVVGASVLNYGGMNGIFTDSSGQFELNNVGFQDTLVISHVSYNPAKYLVSDDTVINVILTKAVNELQPVAVFNTGYQRIPVSQATGSFKQVNMKQVVTSPLRFNVQESFLNNISGYLPALRTASGPALNAGAIRGRITITGNPQPLIVVNDFSFNGDLYMLNPDDIESITVAKDASSTAIYGARSANGIILINTQKADFKQPFRVSFNNYFTFSGKPNVSYMPSLQPKDYVLLEERMFNSHFYDGVENENVPLSPVVETLFKRKSKLISSIETDSILNVFKRNNMRADVREYFYRPAFTYYNGINISGSRDSAAFYGSMSHGRTSFNETGNEHRRTTITLNNKYKLRDLSIINEVFYSENIILNNFVSPPSGPPYLQLAGAEGAPLPVPYQYRSKFVETAGSPYLLDWKMRPLQELRNANKRSNYNYLMLNAKGSYQLTPVLQLQALYQFGQLGFQQRVVHNLETYYARNLINQFTQVTPTDIFRPIPIGAILDENEIATHINSFRFQVDYNRRWKVSELTIMGGSESQSTISNINSSRIYCYGTANEKPHLNYRAFYPQYTDPGIRTQIPTLAERSDSTDYYVSYFANAYYTWSKKITGSLSFRRDQSNRFGRNINQQFIPLWAAGALVHLYKFNFYPAELPYISLRGTVGKTGNDDLQTSWATTISQLNNLSSDLLVTYTNNPPNSNLQFEEMRITNVGVDIKTRNRQIQLSVDMYWKNGSKLLSYSKANPTSGISLVKSNTGRLSGFGIDVNLHTVANIYKDVTWQTSGWMSYTTNKIRSHELLLNEAWQYADPSTYVARTGYPVDALFAFPMSGLDNMGDPIGFVEGKPSKNYGPIITSSDPKLLSYIGSATPVLFGCITNTVQYKRITLSLQISGKFNYYFRRTSLNAYDLLLGGNVHYDYYQSWQQPGDEIHTSIPALRSIIDPSRESFYKYSTALVERGDHIRLQYLQLMYSWNNKKLLKHKNTRLQMGLAFDNLGIIWRMNNKKLDPDVVTGMLPVSRSISASMAVHF